MPHANTEDQLVEQPAIGLFVELGWQVALPHPHPDPLPAGEGEAGPAPKAGVAGKLADAGLLVRETKGEVVLVGRLRAALEKLNASRMGHAALRPEAIAAAVWVIGPVSPAGEMAVFPETLAVARPEILFDRLAVACCKCMIASEFLFEWKTS